MFAVGNVDFECDQMGHLNKLAIATELLNSSNKGFLCITNQLTINMHTDKTFTSAALACVKQTQ